MSILSSIVLFSFVAESYAYPSFFTWAKDYSMVYSSRNEMMLRKQIYDSNVAMISKHNLGNSSWTMAVNKFADLSPQEFKNMFASCKMNVSNTTSSVLEYTAAPASVNWTAKGAVTPVKNQQQCGSCWAFSTTGSTEGAHFLKAGNLVSLSEQQLVDCSGSEGNQGCNGGLMDYAFQYIIKNKGLGSEVAYPYTASDGTCKTVPSVVTLSGFKDVPVNSETALMTAVAQQPVSVAVEADQSVFQFYSGGVMSSACGTQLDHGVLAVGYGTDSKSGLDYWTVKNSWGADWGMNGYILLARGAKFNPSGQCGIQMAASYPIA
jgi:C1A family cysteine protease